MDYIYCIAPIEVQLFLFLCFSSPHGWDVYEVARWYGASLDLFSIWRQSLCSDAAHQVISTSIKSAEEGQDHMHNDSWWNYWYSVAFTVLLGEVRIRRVTGISCLWMHATFHYVSQLILTHSTIFQFSHLPMDSLFKASLSRNISWGIWII